MKALWTDLCTRSSAPFPEAAARSVATAGGGFAAAAASALLIFVMIVQCLFYSREQSLTILHTVLSSTLAFPCMCFGACRLLWPIKNNAKIGQHSIYLQIQCRPEPHLIACAPCNADLQRA